MTIKGGQSRAEPGLDTSDAGVIKTVTALWRSVMTGGPIARLGGDLTGPAGSPKLSTRAGALLHTLLSSRHTDTTAAACVKGALIAGTQPPGGSATWSLLSAPAASTFLKADSSANAGVAWGAASLTMLATVPTSGTPITVPTTVVARLVLVKVSLTPSAMNAATCAVAVETAVGSGTYTTIRTLTVPALGALTVFDYTFPVPGGCRFKLTKGGLAGVTETFDTYTYLDL